MSRNGYTLSITQKGLETQEIYKGQLEVIDKMTANFKNKKNLIHGINQSLNMDLDYNKIELKITYKQDKRDRFVRVLYLKDKAAINIGLTKEKLLQYCKEENFVICFISRYQNSKNLLGLANQIQGNIKTKTNHMSSLQVLIDRLFEGYKAARDIYFFLKEYDIINKRIKQGENSLETTTDMSESLKTLRNSYQRQLTIYDWMQQLNITDQAVEGIVKTKKKNSI